MKTIGYILITLIGSVVGLYIVGHISVWRGVRKVRNKLRREVEPLSKRLEAQEGVDPNEVLAYARQPHLRSTLFQVLKRVGRLDLFPEAFLTDEAQGIARLVPWLMHPHELQTAPEEIELVERVARRVENEECSFLVYKYRMGEGHWAAKDGWILGVVGPFTKNGPPYNETHTRAFSRIKDLYGKITPAELVDWFKNTITKKSA